MATSPVIPPTTAPVPADFKVYRSTLSYNRYVFKDGSVAQFVAGRFITNKKKQMEELDAEIEANNPIISAGEESDLYLVDQHLDPIGALKKKFFAEFQAQQAEIKKITSGEVDFGSYSQGNLKAVSSKDLAALAANNGPSK